MKQRLGRLRDHFRTCWYWTWQELCISKLNLGKRLESWRCQVPSYSFHTSWPFFRTSSVTILSKTVEDSKMGWLWTSAKQQRFWQRLFKRTDTIWLWALENLHATCLDDWLLIRHSSESHCISISYGYLVVPTSRWARMHSSPRLHHPTLPPQLRAAKFTDLQLFSSIVCRQDTRPLASLIVANTKPRKKSIKCGAWVKSRFRLWHVSTQTAKLLIRLIWNSRNAGLIGRFLRTPTP